MLKNYLLSTLLFLVSFSSCSQVKIVDADLQIAAAIMAAPEDERAGATVYGYNEKGEMITLRTGDQFTHLYCR